MPAGLDWETLNAQDIKIESYPPLKTGIKSTKEK
jgi:hypothetical protein